YSAYQQAVERSLVNEEFTAGRTQGVALDYRGDRFHIIGGWTDGHPASGGFNMPAIMPDTDFSLTLRAEGLFSGQWSQFDDMASWKEDETGFMVGGAVHYQEGESGSIADELEVLQWTIDASAEFGGASLLAYIVGRHLSGPIDADQFGIVIQGGYFLTDDWEAFLRWELGDDDTAGDDLNVVTIGATRFFSGHQLKWTTDIGIAIDDVRTTWGDGSLGGGGGIAGWRTGDSGQVVLRSQFQLLF
ncbi:MAG: hypothetical protein ACYS0D_06900, partial [Planctomycetota bacterium]